MRPPPQTLTRQRWRRDLHRLRRREPASSFWRSLALVGTVGWPVALFAVLGVLVGRHLGGGYRAVCVIVGVLLGCAMAFSAIRRDRR